MAEKKASVRETEEEKQLKEAYGWYQRNIRQAGQLVYDLTRGAREGLPERELLETALEAIDRMEGTELRRKLEETRPKEEGKG